MSITHSWNGTILTITSDSGTSSADLKGEKGDKGCRGPQGCCGVSVSEDGSIITTGLATESYVDNAIEIAALNGVDLTEYAKKTDLPSTDDFATKEEVEDITKDVPVLVLDQLYAIFYQLYASGEAYLMPSDGSGEVAFSMNSDGTIKITSAI